MKWVLQKFRGNEGPVINWQVGFEELNPAPKDLFKAWIYYKKASDSVPYNCTENDLKISEISRNIWQCVNTSMKFYSEVKWGGVELGEFEIKHGIVQSGSLSP